MHLDDNPDYKTVWQLMHNWIAANPDESIYPFQNETPALLAGMNTRQILKW